MFKRITLFTAVVVAVLALSAGSASAYFCYNASRSDTGNTNAAKSPALASPTELLTSDGLCPAGITFVLTGLQNAGFDPSSILINERALMASGLEKSPKGEELLRNGKGIDHLSEAFFGTLFPLIGQAFALCGEA